MTTYAKPSYHLPTFNSASFSSSKKSTPQKLQNLSKGMKTPFIVFNDGSVQRTAAHNTTISYITQNTQLSVQPYNSNYIVKNDEVQAIYLPNSAPKNGYEIEIFNSQTIPLLLVSEPHKMFNSLYLPYGETTIAVFPQKLCKLKFFENSWSLLIF